MSRASNRKPEFRLQMGYSVIRLGHGRDRAPLRTARIGDPTIDDDLRGMGEDVARAGGRLTVVLPEPEVWRGALRLAARTPFGRWREARAAVAARLSLPPDALLVAIGTLGPGGTAVAAVPKRTLEEARSFLAGAGLYPADAIGEGDFPGFSEAPRFGPAGLRLPRVPLLDGRAAAAALVLVVLGAAAGLAFWPAPQPSGFAGLPERPVSLTPAPARSAALETSPAPLPRPDPAPQAAAATSVPVVTAASRNLPLLGLPGRDRAPALRLPGLATARARLAGVPPARTPVEPAVEAPRAAAAPAEPRPLRRPATLAPAAEPAAVPGARAEEAAARPRARPEERAGPALASAAAEAARHPRPRPAAAERPRTLPPPWPWRPPPVRRRRPARPRRSPRCGRRRQSRR